MVHAQWTVSASIGITSLREILNGDEQNSNLLTYHNNIYGLTHACESIFCVALLQSPRFAHP